VLSGVPIVFTLHAPLSFFVSLRFSSCELRQHVHLSRDANCTAESPLILWMLVDPCIHCTLNRALAIACVEYH